MKFAKIPTVKVGDVFAHDVHGVVRFTEEARKLQLTNSDPKRIFLATGTGTMALRAKDLCPINDLTAFCIQLDDAQQNFDDLGDTGIMK